MAELDSVIKWLEECTCGNAHCPLCPYDIHVACKTFLMRDALKLLKSKPQIVRCKDCRYGQYCTDGETTYQCFKWNSGEFGELHEQDWFCADGVK